jgi:hypothetical protein
MRGALILAIVVATIGHMASAQIPAGVVPHHFESQTAATASRPTLALDDSAFAAKLIPHSVSSRLRPFAPLVSVLVPGGGQLILGNQRYVAYVAVEALSWWNYAKASRDQSIQEADFKSLARRVGRAHFTTGSPDALPDAPWSYYEHMRDFLESGQYSLSTGPDVVPETDVTTYNGFRWQLALSTNSTRAAALAQYEAQAIRPEFEWSWRNAQLQYDLFTRMTLKRDDAYNAGTHALLIIGANHVLSMIDAFTTIRLRARAEADGRTSIGASLSW